jgi:hypothetical protein
MMARSSCRKLSVSAFATTSLVACAFAVARPALADSHTVQDVPAAAGAGVGVPAQSEIDETIAVRPGQIIEAQIDENGVRPVLLLDGSDIYLVDLMTGRGVKYEGFASRAHQDNPPLIKLSDDEVIPADEALRYPYLIERAR